MCWSVLLIATSVIRLAAIINIPSMITASLMVHDMVLLSHDLKERHEHYDHPSHSPPSTWHRPALAACLDAGAGCRAGPGPQRLARHAAGSPGRAGVCRRARARRAPARRRGQARRAAAAAAGSGGGPGARTARGAGGARAGGPRPRAVAWAQRGR